MKTKKNTPRKLPASHWQQIAQMQSFIKTLEGGYSYTTIGDIEIRGRGVGSPMLAAFLLGYHWHTVKHSALTGKYRLTAAMGFGIEAPTEDFKNGKRNLFGLEFRKSEK